MDRLYAWILGLLVGDAPYDTRIITTAAKLYDYGVTHAHTQCLIHREGVHWLCQRENYLCVKHGSSVNMVALLELVEGVEALTVYAHY